MKKLRLDKEDKQFAQLMADMGPGRTQECYMYYSFHLEASLYICSVKLLRFSVKQGLYLKKMRSALRIWIKEDPIRNQTAPVKVEGKVKPTGICIRIHLMCKILRKRQNYNWEDRKEETRNSQYLHYCYQMIMWHFVFKTFCKL